MPELPEVETIKNQLKKFLTNHKVISIVVKNRNVFKGDETKIIGAKIINARRFGKVTVIDFDNAYSMLTHVKLTGQFIYEGPNFKRVNPLSKKIIGGLNGPHTMVVFDLDRKGHLYYNDVRRFGWIKIEKTKDVLEEAFIKKLGPDMLNINLKSFSEIIKKSKRNIKVLIMDQNKVSGVGNIYINDALYKSGISPKRNATTLTQKEIEKLFNALIFVLKMGLKYGGASELAFVSPDGGEGEYQNHTLVYGNQNKLCQKCKKSKIEKFFLGGRGTYYCPICQK